ncbi:MAG: hypothetical protein RL664_1281, partial [Bacteroidota bacterium]
CAGYANQNGWNRAEIPVDITRQNQYTTNHSNSTTAPSHFVSCSESCRATACETVSIAHSLSPLGLLCMWKVRELRCRSVGASARYRRHARAVAHIAHSEVRIELIAELLLSQFVGTIGITRIENIFIR